MKFLVLALCVCAASAASFGQTPFGSSKGYKNRKGYNQNTATAAIVAPVVVPAVLAAKTAAVVTAPVVNSVAAAADATYTAGAATYNAGAATYNAAKSVVNKGSASEEGQAEILRSDSEITDNGYNYYYETGNGISGKASGELKQVGEATVLVSQGGYAYTSPDGTPVQITYIADENGYQPQGDSIPVGPEIPEAILRSIAYIAAQPKDTAAEKY